MLVTQSKVASKLLNLDEMLFYTEEMSINNVYSLAKSGKKKFENMFISPINVHKTCTILQLGELLDVTVINKTQQAYTTV